MIELLRKLVRGQTRLIGEPVRNLIGPAPQYATPVQTSQEQRWLLLQAAGNALLSIEDFFTAFGEQEQRDRQFLVASNGMTTYVGRHNMVYLLRAVAVVPTTESVPLAVVVGASSDQFAVFVDGVQRARGAGERQLTIPMTQGRHLIEILLDTNSFGVHLPPYISLVADDDNLVAPSWAFVRSAYVDPVLGVLGVQLGWNVDPRCGGWIVHRRDLAGTALIADVGMLQEGGVYGLTVVPVDPLSTKFPKVAAGETVYAGFESIGTVVSSEDRGDAYDPESTLFGSTTYSGSVLLTVRLQADYTEVRQEWIGRDLNSGVFREVARVHRSSAGTVATWTDVSVRLDYGYEYMLQSYGMFDPSVLSPRSSTVYVRAGDDDAPGPITFLEDSPYVINGRAVAKFHTPIDGDYAGVRVFFRDIVQEGTSPNNGMGNTVGRIILAEAPSADIVGHSLVFTSGQNLGMIVQIVGASNGDTTGMAWEFAPTLQYVPTNDTYELANYRSVVVDYGLPDRDDQFSFDPIRDEERLPIYGVYYFPTFDHTRNQQSFEDAALWGYGPSDELCDAPLPPDISIRQLTVVEHDALPWRGNTNGIVDPATGQEWDVDYLDPKIWALVELGAVDACDGKRGVIIEYRRREQWDGTSTSGSGATNTVNSLHDTTRTDIAFYPTVGVEHSNNQGDPVPGQVYREESQYSTLTDSDANGGAGWVPNFFSDRQGILLINPDEANLAAGLYPWWDKNWIANAQWPTMMHYIVSNTEYQLRVSPPFTTSPNQPQGLVVGTPYKIAYRLTPEPDDDPWNSNTLRNYVVQIDNGLGEDQEALIRNNGSTWLDVGPIQAPGAYYVGRGVADKVANGDMQPELPDYIRENDLLLLTVTQRDNVVSTVDAAWTPLFAVNNGAGMRGSVWWTRKVHGVPISSLVTRTAGNTGIAQVFVFRGVDQGVPHFGYGTSNSNGADPVAGRIITFPEITTCPEGSLAVLLGFTGDDGYARDPKSTSSTLDLVERYDSNTNLGNDAGLVVFTSELFDGSTGLYTAQYSLAEYHIGATIVFRSNFTDDTAPAWDPDLIPDNTSVYHISWVSGLAATAPVKLDNPLNSQQRGRLVAINKTESDNFIVVRARDKDNNLSQELTYAPDFDTDPELASVSVRLWWDGSGWRVFVIAVADDDTGSAKWWVYPDQFVKDASGNMVLDPESPTATDPAVVDDLTSNKSFSFSFPFGNKDPLFGTDVARVVLYIKPYSQPNCQGAEGVLWSEEIVRHPTTTVLIEPRDEAGRTTRTKSRLTFKVSPRIPEEPTRTSGTGAELTQNSTGPAYEDLVDSLGGFPVGTGGVGGYTYTTSGEPAYNWYFAEISNGDAANKLRQLVSNDATRLVVAPGWTSRPGPPEYPKLGDNYRLWRGATWWRVLVETKEPGQPVTLQEDGELGRWMCTNNPEVIDRSRYRSNQELIVQFYSVITGVPKEPIKSVRIDPDNVAEINAWELALDAACTLHVTVNQWDDDALTWRAYVKRGSWPVLGSALTLDHTNGAVADPHTNSNGGAWYTPLGTAVQALEGRTLDRDGFERMDQKFPTTLGGQNDFAMELMSESGWWYVILLPINSWGEAGQRVYGMIEQTEECLVGPPVDPNGVWDLTNFAVYMEQVDGRYIQSLNWQNTGALEAGAPGQYLVTIQAVRTDLPGSYMATLCTDRDARFDVSGSISAFQSGANTNTSTNVGSIYHFTDLGQGSDRGLLWWHPPMAVPANQSPARYRWNYTITLTDTVNNRTKTYTHPHEGWYTNGGPASTNISNLVLAVNDGGLCVTSGGSLLGQPIRLASPGVSFRLSWDVSNANNNTYYTQAWIAVTDGPAPTEQEWILQGTFSPGFPYQPNLPSTTTTCVIGTSGEDAWVETTDPGIVTNHVDDEVLVASGTLLITTTGNTTFWPKYPSAQRNLRAVVVEQDGNTLTYGGRGQTPGTGADYAFNADTGEFWFWDNAPNLQPTWLAGPQITVTYDYGDPSTQITGGTYYNADRVVWARVRLIDRTTMLSSFTSLTVVTTLTTSMTLRLGKCNGGYLNI